MTVEVLVFSGEVTMTVRREFAGGGGGAAALAQKSLVSPALLGRRTDLRRPDLARRLGDLV